MKTSLAIIGLILTTAFIASGAGSDPDRFIEKIKLPTGQFVVVAEGDFEPRSLGSYRVRLYSGENPQFPYDDFVDGVIRARPDGFIEKVVLADIDGDGRVEIVVILRCVGSGQYLSAEAFAFDKKKLVFRASVGDLAWDADPVVALKKAKK